MRSDKNTQCATLHYRSASWTPRLMKSWIRSSSSGLWAIGPVSSIFVIYATTEFTGQFLRGNSLQIFFTAYFYFFHREAVNCTFGFRNVNILTFFDKQMTKLCLFQSSHHSPVFLAITSYSGVRVRVGFNVPPNSS